MKYLTTTILLKIMFTEICCFPVCFISDNKSLICFCQDIFVFQIKIVNRKTNTNQLERVTEISSDL